MKALVGYTGFVGSNLCESGDFDCLYNSKNIADAYGTCPDILVYSGVRAEKYLANNAPEKDMEQILQALDNIRQINPKKLVLISTVDVFKSPIGVNEDTVIDLNGLHPYGYNRYMLEVWVREHFPDALIVRLPGLFGKNIKKNFIYDFISVIPFMLKKDKFEELVVKDPRLSFYYELQENGFYKVNIADEDREALKEVFKNLGFSALNFTDSRSIYQYYDLRRLYNDIKTALDSDLLLWHAATEPIMTGELYEFLTGKPFLNELGGVPVSYDYRTIYDELYGGKDGFICDKETVLEQIKSFVSGY